MRAVRQDWLESERGWGTRPDGFSLHLSMEQLNKYVADYWDGTPDSAPDEYSRPDGNPYEVDVPEEEFLEIQKSSLGVRRYR